MMLPRPSLLSRLSRLPSASTLVASALLLAAGCNSDSLPFVPLGPPMGADAGPDGSAGPPDLSPLEVCKLTCDPDWSCDDSGACVQPAMPGPSGGPPDAGTRHG